MTATTSKKQTRNPRAATASGLSLAAIQPTKPEAPAAEPDPLRWEHWYDLPPEQERARRDQLLGMILKSVAQMRGSRLQEVARFVDIVKHDQGFTTPTEQFITNLVSLHYDNEGLTPDGALREIEGPEGFRVNFSEIADNARRFLAAYPALLSSAPASTPALTE